MHTRLFTHETSSHVGCQVHTQLPPHPRKHLLYLVHSGRYAAIRTAYRAHRNSTAAACYARRNVWLKQRCTPYRGYLLHHRINTKKYTRKSLTCSSCRVIFQLPRDDSFALPSHLQSESLHASTRHPKRRTQGDEIIAILEQYRRQQYILYRDTSTSSSLNITPLLTTMRTSSCHRGELHTVANGS